MNKNEYIWSGVYTSVYNLVDNMSDIQKVLHGYTREDISHALRRNPFIFSRKGDTIAITFRTPFPPVFSGNKGRVWTAVYTAASIDKLKDIAAEIGLPYESVKYDLRDAVAARRWSEGKGIIF